MPIVSVVIPAYNVEQYILLSLNSVLAQSFTDFEVLVIDDGSTDDTARLAASVSDPRVRVISQANRGLAGARNAGIRAAGGRYIAFLDADDLWDPRKLGRHVSHLDARPMVGVSYSQSAFMDDAGQGMGLLQKPKLNGISAADIFLRNPVGNGSAPVIRAEALREIAFPAPTGVAQELWYFDETFRQSEDIECWMRLALTTRWRFEGIGEPLTLYRVNAGGLSANVERQFASWERMVERMNAYAPQFVARWHRSARGFQLRYLARRSIRMGRPGHGLVLAGRAVVSHPAMLKQEFARTTVTLAAALAAVALPATVYRRLESTAMQVAGRMQRARSQPEIAFATSTFSTGAST